MSDRDPLPFPSKTDVPIVGQPCHVDASFLTTLIVCHCEARAPVLIVGVGSVGTCKGCGKGYRVLGVRIDLRNGQPPHYDIDVVLPGPREAAH